MAYAQEGFGWVLALLHSFPHIQEGYGLQVGPCRLRKAHSSQLSPISLDQKNRPLDICFGSHLIGKIRKQENNWKQWLRENLAIGENW